MLLFGEAPQDRPAVWHPPPEYRGSFTILSTCIITLALCIWTSLHLNIPEQQANKKRSNWNPKAWVTPQQWRKVSWLVLGLLAPEMIAFTAWVQRRNAYNLTKEIQEVWDEQLRGTPRPSTSPTGARVSIGARSSQANHGAQSSPESLDRGSMGHFGLFRDSEQDIELGSIPGLEAQSSEQNSQAGRLLSWVRQQDPADYSPESTTKRLPRKHQWTVTHSFFALSGGFAFDTTGLPEDQKFLPGSRNRVTLNQKAVLLVAKHFPSLLPDISEAAIADKSKANALAKAIACLQATWFVIQCLVRLTQNVPISLLELNTLTHALFALIIYGLWWRKPLDVEEPTLIDDESAHGICAFLCCLSTFDEICDGKRLDFDETPLRSRERSQPSGNIRSVLSSSGSQLPGAERLDNGQCIPGTGIRGYCHSYLRGNESFWYFPHDLRRWKLAYSTWESNRPELAKLLQHERELENKWGQRFPKCRLHDRARNRPSTGGFTDIFGLIFGDAFSERPDGVVVLFAFTCAGLTYGALHLLAWNSPFSSVAQKKLWRISAVAIAASGAIVILLGLLCRWLVVAREDMPDDSYFRRLWNIMFIGIIVAIVVLFLLFYLFSRVYLVIECFVSMAYLPEGVFQQPKWTYYFPHIA
ncbi:hypothetical protein J3458_001620 [Metarhizium acridum]|uniref:uncharacterized protein n=2 Tax=Metarhizium acridum TaxID=92637 RepID=UPI001C6B026F|nr:hypothetical protein J3458_001620 [Metarhizium acridum]